MNGRLSDRHAAELHTGVVVVKIRSGEIKISRRRGAYVSYRPCV